MLGNNYRNDPEQFDEQIEDVLDLLAPAPVLLLTVTEFEDAQVEVNYVLGAEAAERDNVQVVDWAKRTRHDDSLVGADGLHLSERGKVALWRWCAWRSETLRLAASASASTIDAGRELPNSVISGRCSWVGASPGTRRRLRGGRRSGTAEPARTTPTRRARASRDRGRDAVRS